MYMAKRFKVLPLAKYIEFPVFEHLFVNTVIFGATRRNTRCPQGPAES